MTETTVMTETTGKAAMAETTATTTEPRARFGDLVAAEWLKMRSLRSTSWSLLIAGLAVVGINVGTAYDTYHYWTDEGPAGRARYIRDGIPLQEAFTANSSLVLVLASGAVGALFLVAEFRTGLIRTTFAAVPARRPLMAAKLLVTAAVMTVFGAVVAGGSFWLTQAILAGRGIGVSIGHPGAWSLVVASALLAPVSALVGMALGALLRQSGTTLVALFVLMLLLPVALSDDRHLTAVVGHAMPYKAWLFFAEPGRPDVLFPSTSTGAWLVLAIWPVAAAAVTVFGVERRDL
ncbi:ABC transporter permease [Streptomyces sp. NPDC048518]|uniref:ABC transporter permease n=1 Tax=Streptomyces sp. NPDC048518 TaxID=3155029 RepID=UPI00340563B2